MSLSDEVERNVDAALIEDIGGGDLTALLIPAEQIVTASVVCRVAAVVCGVAWFEACFKRLDPTVEVRWQIAESDESQAGQTLCTVRGNARALLTVERTALNFLQTLSATATCARRYVTAVRDTKALIMDTRKTLPGLRCAQKYAVKIGGGANQRVGLHDGILIKENHIIVAGGIAQALQRAAEVNTRGVPVQVEVESLDELAQALAAGAKLILLDNFSLEQMRAAVQFSAGHVVLEASGGITLDNVLAVAETGVDRISIGALTKDVQAVDLSMRFSHTVA